MSGQRYNVTVEAQFYVELDPEPTDDLELGDAIREAASEYLPVNADLIDVDYYRAPVR